MTDQKNSDNGSFNNESKNENHWTAHGKSIALALGFFTRLPTWQLKEISHHDMGRALLYFPIVGLAVGLTTVTVGLLLESFLTGWHGELSLIQQGMIGFLTFTLIVTLTGGLHLNGVADCADAWVGGLGDKERTLEIMKDPTCGPMAVCVLLLLLLLKAAAVVALVLKSEWLIILLIPVLSRTAGMALFMFTDYVRPKGLGQAFSDFAIQPICYLSLLAGISIPLWLIGTPLLVPLILTILLWFWIRRQSIARIGGFTGDVAGSVIEFTEVSLLVTLALLI